MNEWERFSKAPIVEALLDIRVRLPSEVTLREMEELHSRIRDRYPKSRKRRRFEGQFNIAESSVEVAPTTLQVDGLFFSTESGDQIVQARKDGFTFNKLKPYDRWEPFRDEGREHWELYREVARPEAVTRIALRYINRIPLPLPLKDFRDYVTTTPEIAPGLPQGLRAFLMRLEIPDERGIAVVTETLEPPEELEGKSVLPLILDIDVIREGELDPSDESIWENFEGLRDFKNEIFFKSVTDGAKELFR